MEMEILPALTVRENVADAVCGVVAESVTRKVSDTPFADADGEPAMVPVVALRANPEGNEPAVSDHS